MKLNDYIKQTYGEKLYKIALSAPVSCPNRDGRLDTRGCIFCSAGGSGDFAAPVHLPVDQQIDVAKEKVAKKFKGNHYIAYFQAYSNTYAPIETLRAYFDPVMAREDIKILSIATRPDCLSEDVYALLEEYVKIKPVWVELGLQTIHKKTADYIRRGYDLSVYDEAVRRLNALGIHTVTHLILGLPGETEAMMLESVDHVVRMRSAGIKLQLLHVLEGTDLAGDFRAGKFESLSLEHYAALLNKCLERIPSSTVIHRITGDGPKKLLIAPMWSANKRMVLNYLNQHVSIP